MKDMTVEEAWELTRKITFLDKDGGFDSSYFGKVFSGMNKGQVFELSPYEIKERIEKYDKEHEILVGDIVADKEDIRYFVLDEDLHNGNQIFHLLSENGCVECMKRSLLRRITRTNYVEQLIDSLRRTPIF